MMLGRSLLALLAASATLAASQPQGGQGQGRRQGGNNRRRAEQAAPVSGPGFELLRDGRPWRRVGFKEVLGTAQGQRVQASQAPGRGLFDFLKSEGVVKARRVVVKGPGLEVLEVEWSADAPAAQQHALLLTGPATLGLRAPAKGGPPQVKVQDVRSIDVHDAQVARAAPDPRRMGRGMGRAAEAPADVAVLGADGQSRPLALSAVRAASARTARWHGRETTVTPLARVLEAAGIPRDARVRVVSDDGVLVLQAGSKELADPKDYSVVFNRRGFPVLAAQPTIQPLEGEKGQLSPAPSPAPAANAARQPLELKRISRIEVVR
jgi:hypothetical protein